ncbi:hypothetical protein AN189_09085 [Loktanella sp. 3ANDIMAR09]|uniref:GNAT family N-acetyltransferase n=1 Tax=Loktanella sp. 3ANDIMAR09 TaxID=1225657 RepID=UPI0006F93509|nr:GNAT family N-acyltransferase [Loktanella sp. 3ANDIMAR09]KQI68467.1 hypothetical protein AN189_09085 [Loktanella sp. 3ANDIMAR09]
MNVPYDTQSPPLTVRAAAGPVDLLACQMLRHRCFFGTDGCDSDGHDAICDHLMIEQDGVLRGTLRTLLVDDGRDLDRTLTAQSYDLSPLRDYPAPVLEIGRFCIGAGALDAHVMRVALGALAGLVDRAGIGLMIGCTSLAGSDPARHAAALAVLGRHHVGPDRMRPLRAATTTVPLGGQVTDRRRAVASLPPLLRSYLGLGGWVSDHAVIDAAMDTVHVFTCVEVDRIPAIRASALRRLVV